MKKRGLSVDEKRERMLNIFHEKKEVFNLKEIEKFSTKVGIVLPTVKDILLALMSDDLVDSDKIGSANFYWSLPSKTYQIIKTKLGEIDGKISNLEQQKELLQDALTNSMKGKDESKKRTQNLEKLNELKKIYEGKQKEISKYMRNDPERKEQLEQETEILKVKVNEWTDNIFLLKQWIQGKASMSDEDLEQSFQIPMELDYIQ